MKILPKTFAKEAFYYLIAPIISALIIIYYFKLDIVFKDIDSSKLFFFFGDKDFVKNLLKSPSDYFRLHNDSMLALANIKIIAKEGLTYCSKYVSYPQIDTNCFNDYSQDHNFLISITIKFLSFFSKNPLTILYYYSFLSIFLITLSANFVLRKLGISKFNATFLAILFSLTNNRLSYFFIVSVGNYFIIPFLILMSYWLYERKLLFLGVKDNLKKTIFIQPNIYFFYCLIIAIISLTTSVYYGYALIMLCFLSLILDYLRFKKFDLYFFSILALIFVSVALAILIGFPTFMFWIQNGSNSFISRAPIESVAHGISISAMLIPNSHHLIDFFREFSNDFREAYSFFCNEKSWQSIGLLASIGFCSLLFLSLSNSTKQQKDSENQFFGIKFAKDKYNLLIFIASLNLLAILFFSIESFYSFINFYFAQIRGIGRLNVIFIFLALIFFGLVFDEIIKQRKIVKNTLIAKILLVLTYSLALLDANPSSKYLSSNFAKNTEHYYDYRGFVENIENSLPRESMIFVTPVIGFPEVGFDDYGSLIGYIFGDNLKFSYPNIKGRKAHKWQKKVAGLDFDNFIKEIRKEGFTGVWVQRNLYGKFGKGKLSDFENKLQRISKNKIESNDKIFVFYKI